MLLIFDLAPVVSRMLAILYSLVKYIHFFHRVHNYSIRQLSFIYYYASFSIYYYVIYLLFMTDFP